jgi:hypothetical protein
LKCFSVRVILSGVDIMAATQRFVGLALFFQLVGSVNFPGRDSTLSGFIGDRHRYRLR